MAQVLTGCKLMPLDCTLFDHQMSKHILQTQHCNAVTEIGRESAQVHCHELLHAMAAA